MHEEHNQKYIINNKRVILCFHRVTVEKSGLLGCCDMWLGNLFLTIRRNAAPYLHDYEWIHVHITLNMKAVRPFETLGSKDPADMVPQQIKRSAANDVFQLYIASRV